MRYDIVDWHIENSRLVYKSNMIITQNFQCTCINIFKGMAADFLPEFQKIENLFNKLSKFEQLTVLGLNHQVILFWTRLILVNMERFWYMLYKIYYVVFKICSAENKMKCTNQKIYREWWPNCFPLSSSL